VKEYLFAYGSLIGTASHSHGGPRIPVRVAGLKRGWYIPIPEDGNSGLGAVLRPESVCNGVLIESNERHLAGTDEREKQRGLTPCSVKLSRLNQPSGRTPRGGSRSRSV